jgi:hypothetical protein
MINKLGEWIQKISFQVALKLTLPDLIAIPLFFVCDNLKKSPALLIEIFFQIGHLALERGTIYSVK